MLAKISPFSPQKRPFVFRLIRSPIAADTGTRHRKKIAPEPGLTPHIVHILPVWDACGLTGSQTPQILVFPQIVKRVLNQGYCVQ